MEPNSSKPRVLFVDDDQNVLSGAARVLRRHFVLVTALGPEQCLAAIEKDGPFSVVVADMNMPGMDGLTLLSKVRAASPGTAAILLTGDADLSAARAALRDGAISGVLTKPCPPTLLIPRLLAASEQSMEAPVRASAIGPTGSRTPVEQPVAPQKEPHDGNTT